MLFAVFFVHVRVGADDDEVALLCEAGGGAVDADDAGATFALDSVGGKAFAVIDVEDVDLLVRHDVGLVHYRAVDGDRALVMKVGMRHRGAVNLAFEHPDIHVVSTSIEYGIQVKRRALMAYDDNNIFAKILRGEIPCKKVYEDDYVLAFDDIAPRAPVHILVIPKGKYISISDFGAKASAEEVKGFYAAVSKIAGEKGLEETGFRTIANTGLNGGQEVPHFHVHILGGKKLGPMLAG